MNSVFTVNLQIRRKLLKNIFAHLHEKFAAAATFSETHKVPRKVKNDNHCEVHTSPFTHQSFYR